MRKLLLGLTAILSMILAAEHALALGEISRMIMRDLYRNAQAVSPEVEEGFKKYFDADSVEFLPIKWAPDFKDKFTITASAQWAHLTFYAKISKLKERVSLDCEGWIDPKNRRMQIVISTCKITGDQSLVMYINDDTNIPF